MTIADEKLSGIPRMVREGRVREACELAADVLDVAAAHADRRDLSADSLVILRDLLDTVKKGRT